MGEPSEQTGQRLPAFVTTGLPAGTRLGLAVSGGADSMALLRLAARLAPEHGWTLTVLHVEHGLRGEESRADAAFVRATAAGHGLAFHLHAGDAAADAHRAGTGLENAGRRLRYGWFGSLLAAGELDAIATGHTLDDQAETVLAKLLRGAWTRGLAGIHPVVAARDLPGASTTAAAAARGMLVRPLLTTRRDALRSWLRTLGQDWREDSSNTDLAFGRNHIRHQLLPAMHAYAPQAEEALAHTAALALDDEAYWQAEVERLLPGTLLPGRPVRGGGRASSTLGGEHSLAFEVQRLRTVPTALRRRLLRAAAARLGARVDFAATAAMLALCEGTAGSAPRRAQLSHTLRAERTARELRLVVVPTAEAGPSQPRSAAVASVPIPVPGSGAGWGIRVTVAPAPGAEPGGEAILRATVPGDRVRLRYSSGAPKRIKEVLERKGVPAEERAVWPVLVYSGEIVWMRGTALEPNEASRQLTITAESDEAAADAS